VCWNSGFGTSGEVVARTICSCLVRGAHDSLQFFAVVSSSVCLARLYCSRQTFILGVLSERRPRILTTLLHAWFLAVRTLQPRQAWNRLQAHINSSTAASNPQLISPASTPQPASPPTAPLNFSPQIVPISGYKVRTLNIYTLIPRFELPGSIFVSVPRLPLPS
jgi:hypothetical protein